MGKGLDRLTDRALRSAIGRKEGARSVATLCDGKGLYLVVDWRRQGGGGHGVASWVFRWMSEGKAKAMGLGPYPDVGLAAARQLAAQARADKAAGLDPRQARLAREAEEAAAVAAAAQAAERAVSFRQAAEEYMRTLEWKAGSKSASLWSARFRDYAFPLIGEISVASIDMPSIVGVLQQSVVGRTLWQAKPETASKLRNQIERVLNWAEARGFRGEGKNPAALDDKLKKTLGEQPQGKNFSALPVKQMPHFMSALQQIDSVGAVALRFAILTAARSGEVRLATWDQVDFDRGMWTIPGHKMKGKRTKNRPDHRVPLSAEALSVLQRLPRGLGPDLVFAAPSGGPLSDMTLSAVIRRMNAHGKAGQQPVWVDIAGKPVVPHGFRSTFRDWVGEETAFPSEMAEIALAHTVGSDVERTYRRGDMVEKRRAMMAAWAAFASATTALTSSNERRREPELQPRPRRRTAVRSTPSCP